MTESNSQHLFDDCFPASLEQPSEQFIPNYSQTIEQTHKASLDCLSRHILITHYEPYEDKQKSCELLENFDMSSIISSNRFQLNLLIRKIQEEANYQLQNCEVMVYFPTGELYVSFGVHPLYTNVTLSLEEYMDVTSQTLKLKTKRVPFSFIHIQMMKNTSKLLLNGPPKKFRQTEESQFDRKNNIKNFQKVGYIVKKVLGIKQNKSNEQLAEEGYIFRNDRQLTKKSVQDYYYQIRMGCKYGYNFNQNCEKNMKHLRQFNRKMQKYHQQRLLMSQVKAK